MTLLRKLALTFSAAIIGFSTNVASAADVTPLYNDKGNIIAKISRIAGNGMYGEQEGVASASSFRQPTGLAVGAKDDLFISDTGNHKISIFSSENISTYVGPSSSLLRDSGGQPLGALLNGNKGTALFQAPSALAYSTDKNLYIADSGNNAIRKVSSTGEVVTIAGNGRIGDSDGKGTAALFNHPQGIAVTKSGIVYVADTLNHVIRKIMPDGTTSTITAASDRVVENHPGFVVAAGDYKDGPIHMALFNEPTGLALDNSENLFVSDSGNQRIRYIDFSRNQVITVAGESKVERVSIYSKDALYAPGNYKDGASQSAAFHFPRGITLDKSGGLLIADSLNNVIRYLKNGIVTTVAGSPTGEAGAKNGLEKLALFNTPQDVAIASDGTIYVADMGNNIIRKIDPYALPANIIGNKSVIKVVLENRQLKFDTSPEMNTGRVMVPVRQIAEALGFEISFSSDGTTINLEKDNRSTQLFLGSKNIKIKDLNGTEKTKEVDTAPYVKKSRTYVSLRFIAEELGIDVQWVPTSRTAILRNSIGVEL
ncbi:stalk domain-containing protein [Paenibacillus xylanexedens]|uniref:stalk domain-containing protein n=1 Tax=Paenibacillus xylanexedens TaxID=528191 RepID=UPI00119ECBB3|nr:stalk domain-containing protein [Paenibacillus xylanexedens]